MKKLFKRFIAYLIDMLVVLLITQSLSGIPQINKQLDDYNMYYDDYLELYEDYASFKMDLDKDYEDEKLTEEEYNNLIEEHVGYIDTINKYYIDGELTKNNYDKLNERIDKEYNNTYREVYYKIEKNSITYFIIYLVAVIAYFIGFNKYTNGQTLGKKLMKLKIINNKDESKDVPIWSYIVRALILYQPIYYIVKLIGVNFMEMNTYYEVTNVVYSIQGYIEMLVIAMMMIRLDGRGPQDLLANTKVALYDRNGNEIKDKLNTIISDKLHEVGITSKKVIDEEVIEENTSEDLTKKKEMKPKKKTPKKENTIRKIR